MGYLDYPGLQRYHGKVQDEIDDLKDDLGEPVRFDVEQTATDAEKLQARTNIGAISEAAKEALVEMFRHVVYIDSTSEQLLNDLIEKLNIDTEPIPDISISDITYRYGLNTAYSGSDIPYCLAKNFRACYKDFDIDVDREECYKIKWNKETYPLSSANICFYTQSARTKVNNHNEIVLSNDYVETAWLDYDSIVQVPKDLLGGNIVGARFSFKANDDSSLNFDTDGLEPLTLTKVDIDPARAYRVLGLGSDLDKYNQVQNTYPYNSRDLGWGNPRTRIAYWKFDYPIVAGGRYYVEFDTSTCPEANCGIDFGNDNILSEIENHQTLSDANISPSGWFASGSTITAPTTINGSPTKVIRISFRRNSSSSNFDDSHLVKYMRLKYLGMGA